MPINQHFHTPSGGELSLWEIEEEPRELLESLTMTEQAREEWNRISHPKRQREWLAARHLFHELGIAEEVYYLDNGKPSLKDGRKISISHSRDLVGVLIHEEKDVGIDIQAPNEKLVKISSRYCNAGEMEFAKNSPNPLEAFTIIWSAKEAVFKVFGENINFAEQMSVVPFDLGQEQVSLEFTNQNMKTNFQLPLMRTGKYFLLLAEE